VALLNRFTQLGRPTTVPVVAMASLRLGWGSSRCAFDLCNKAIGLPMTTAAYNADNPFAVAAGTASGSKAGKTRYVLCHQPKSFDWRARRASPHPMKQLNHAVFAEVFALLNQIIVLA
jgi:mRNA interferase MazF